MSDWWKMWLVIFNIVAWTKNKLKGYWKKFKKDFYKLVFYK